MLLSIFKHNNILSVIILALLLLVLWLPALQESNPLPYNNTMPLYEVYVRGVNYIPIFHNIVALILVFAEGFFLNYVLNKLEIMLERTYMPALFYCLIMSCCKELTGFYPLLISNFFILLVLLKIGQSYRVDQAYSSIFNASLLIAIASLFYFPVIFIYPVIWVTLIVIRPFIWREWIISLMGLFLPYLYAFSYYFITDKVNFFLFDKIFFPSSDMAISLKGMPVPFLIVASVLLLLTLLSLGALLKGWPVNTIFSRNFLVVLLWLLGLSLLSFSMAPIYNIRYLMLMTIPLAAFMANFFMVTRMKWLSELLLWLFIGSSILEIYT